MISYTHKQILRVQFNNTDSYLNLKSLATLKNRDEYFIVALV